MELYPIALSRLPYDESGQFIFRLFSDMELLPVDIDNDKDFNEGIKTLRRQSEVFKVALKQIIAQSQTKELEKLDTIRDQKLTILRRQISVYQYSDVKEEQHAYAIATIIMKKYAGIECTNFEAESFGLKKLLDEWAKPENTATVKVLNLDFHLKKLQQAADNFTIVFDQRSSIVTQKENYDSFALKRQMMDNYDKLAKYVLSMISMKKDNEFYLILLSAFNNGRHYFADIIARRDGRRAAGKDDEEVG